MNFSLKIGCVYLSPITVITALVIVYLTESALSLLVYVFAFIHEMGHLICMRLCKIKVERVDIYPLSISITPDRRRILSYRHQAVIASAGPAISLITALVFLAIGHFYPFEALPFCFFGNLWLCFINMLPVPLLDGGKVLQSVVMMKVDFVKGERICKITAFMACFAGIILGAYIFFVTKYNASLMIMSVYMAISLYFAKSL